MFYRRSLSKSLTGGKVLRKINYSKVFILGVFLYIVSQVVSTLICKNVESQVLESSKLDLKIHTKGLIIRDEYIIKSNDRGKLKLLVKEGEKVKKSQEVAKIYKDDRDFDIDKEISRLDTEIKNIKKSKLDSDIEKSKLKVKQDERDILQSKRQDRVSTLTSDMSGIVSYKLDNNEEKYKYDYFDEITEESIENAINNYEQIDKEERKIKDNEIVMRVINPNDVYVAICISKQEGEKFKVGEFVKLKMKDSDLGYIDAKIEEKHTNKSKVVVILKITNQNVGIYDARVTEFDIIYSEIEGLRIPKESIKLVDGNKGVYVLDESSERLRFVKLKGIVYEGDDFVFVDYYKNNINGVKTVNLYDKILLKPNVINRKIFLKNS